jgi:predicted ATP-grasp superfamily ATP-dependent carboligase
MLFAIAEDIARLPGVRAAITLDARVAPPPARESLEVVSVARQDEAGLRFRELARECDGTLVIAPETDGVLARAAAAVLDAGGRLLGTGPEAVERASDKLLLPAVLEAAGVPSIPAAPWNPHARAFPGTIVVKPRRGAGSERVVLVDGGSRPAPEGEDLIATPFIPGTPASVLVIAGEGGAAPLRACSQDLSPAGDFAYLGGRLPLARPLEERARRLALAAAEAIPGIAGFAGVDLILGPGAEPGGPPRDAVVEVNARLTTSYVGLRSHARTNLAAVWLAAVLGKPLPSIVWRPGETRFQADGTVSSTP